MKRLKNKIHTEIPVFEYNQITKYVFIGTNRCCKMHFAKELASKGIKADISLEEDKVDNPFGVKYFLWLPTKDHQAPTLNQFSIGVNFIEQLIKANIKIYVHCKNGHGRAPTLVATYFIKKGMSINKAISLIKNKRKTIHPNKHQRRALNSFENYLRNNRS